MTTRSESLPESVQQIADVIGRDAALRLVNRLPRSYAGRRQSGIPMLYVPRLLSPDHSLVQLIGFPAAQKLVRAFGGEILYPAACIDVVRHARNREIVRLLNDGWDERVIAYTFGMTVRQLKNIRREIVSEETPPIQAHDGAVQST